MDNITTMVNEVVRQGVDERFAIEFLTDNGPWIEDGEWDIATQEEIKNAIMEAWQDEEAEKEYGMWGERGNYFNI